MEKTIIEVNGVKLDRPGQPDFDADRGPAREDRRYFPEALCVMSDELDRIKNALRLTGKATMGTGWCDRVDTLLSGVPVPNVDLGFDSPADRAARPVSGFNDALEQAASFLEKRAYEHNETSPTREITERRIRDLAGSIRAMRRAESTRKGT